jgi:hypothetical protein
MSEKRDGPVNEEVRGLEALLIVVLFDQGH